MTEPPKPRHGTDYRPEDLLQVRSALLTVAVTLGSYLDDLCVVGGVVPSLLIDREGDDEEPAHFGTSDLDVALAVALLDDSRYAEISQRLRNEDFEPDRNAAGNPTLQRWKLKDRKVTIDFLIEPNGEKAGTIKKLESDFGALVTTGLNLAFEDREVVRLEGLTLSGEQHHCGVPVCGPAGFVVLKAFALQGRGERKDAYDLVYVVKHWPERAAGVASRLHALSAQPVVEQAIQVLEQYFAEVESVGSQRAAKFVLAPDAHQDEIDDRAADDRAIVLDLTDLWRSAGST